ncbi:hypothetical protein BGU85_26930, partial [Clostridioides difficile]|uniref:YbaK/EbsC family protein n=1 Tax=Clostridioides difficile TaxID=1496 RepID=UPI000BD9D52C
LRDAKGKEHFLVVLGKDKKADLKDIRQQIDSKPLSFASEERLLDTIPDMKDELRRPMMLLVSAKKR